MLQPPALQAGDVVAVIAPASPSPRGDVEAGCAALRQLGFEPRYDASILSLDLYFAGDLRRRLNELHAAFLDPAVAGIFCARGGYGSNYLLPRLDVELIRRNAKVFFGYSDLTSLTTYIQDQTGLVTFHGPMVAKDFNHEGGVDEASFCGSVMGNTYTLAAADGLSALRAGTAEGVLYGGCLSMLAASLGTPYEIHTEGKLLFIEDLATKPYQIDRMLMQLKLAGKFAGVAGVIFGEMLDCVQPGKQNYTLQDVVLRVLADSSFPIGYGLRSGHVSRGNVTLPMGVPARLTVQAEARLELLPRATATPLAGKRAVRP